ncbi:MAG: phage tail tape measure protein [Chloroflexi bacterium]|nr:phage tail tape measure protein [Chloroflexota bacterium]
MNSSDDFLDSIGEYGPQFAGLGFDAAEFFSVMETGMASGVLGTDKIADSVKEWGIIMTTEAGRASSALDVLGMDYDAIAAAVGSGDAVWADYFDEIVGGLQAIEDPVLQQQTAIALFGTMAEDMGAGFLEGLDMMATGLGEMEGATAIAGHAI